PRHLHSFPTRRSSDLTGDGLTVGPFAYEFNRFGNDLHLIQAHVTIASNATPGLRTLVVRGSGEVAYANGYFEVMAAAPDYNFDRSEEHTSELQSQSNL